MTVPRVGAGHDGTGESEYPSASRLRAMLEAGENIDDFVPSLPEEPPVFLRDLELPILSRLRMLPLPALSEVPGAEEGLENVLYRAVRAESTLEGICAAAKSKRYPMSRLRRMTLCAALGVTKELSSGLPPYLRVLGATERGRALLHEMRSRATLPVITKPAAVKTLDARANAVFCLTAAAHDLYVLGHPNPGGRAPGQDWRQTPAMV